MSKSKNSSYIHPAGWPFIAAAFALVFVLSKLGTGAFFLGLILACWVVYFFRNPERTTPTRAGLVVAPADGRVCAISEVIPEDELGLGDEPRIRVSIFLNVFNVHVNRAPVEGTVDHIQYRAGKFFNASLDKASVDNERNALAITMTGEHAYKGQKMGVVQIAGLIARRILCHAKVSDKVETGERFGLIRFGSRTDLYLPKGMKPLVCVGQTMIGGETIMADCQSEEDTREGEVH